MQKAKWATARIVFMVAAGSSIATGNVLGYLLGPLYSWYFFNDLNFFKYHRFFFSMTVCGWRMLNELLRNPGYRHMFAIPLTAPPKQGPDLSLVRVRTDWRESDGGCNGCVQCCIRRSCPLLDSERNLCRSYGSFFWRYFNCGRYPENVAQIRHYDCPKWEMNA
ncbi:MAG: hypothetical protein ACYC7J_02955 [Syntrophales bacterium]